MAKSNKSASAPVVMVKITSSLTKRDRGTLRRYWRAEDSAVTHSLRANWRDSAVPQALADRIGAKYVVIGAPAKPARAPKAPKVAAEVAAEPAAE